MINKTTIHLMTGMLCMLTIPPAELNAQFVELPPEKESTWYMGNAGELIALVAFDHALIVDSIPDGLGLVTLVQIASGDPQIGQYLLEHPDHANYGLGLVEIVWQDSFTIDNHRIQGNRAGAVAVWFALVNSSGMNESRARGTSWLSLGFWMSDSTFVKNAQESGWHFEFADVSYRYETDGVVIGEILRQDLTVSGLCRPSQNRRYLGDSDTAIQTIWFPKSEPQRFALITFEGHHERDCVESQWVFSGSHPLGFVQFIYSPGLQDGYDLIGGLYTHP